MPYIEGYSYPPGRGDDDDSIYVKSRDMDRFARTALGKPLNRKSHPEPGKPSSQFQVGTVVGTRIDPKTGAMVVRAKLDNSFEGWCTFHDIQEGRLRQFSAGKEFDMDIDTADVYNHEITEVSAVEQGDNELGVGFATDIFPPRLPEDFERNQQKVLRLLQNAHRHQSTGGLDWHTSGLGRKEYPIGEMTDQAAAPPQQPAAPTEDGNNTESDASRLDALMQNLRKEIDGAKAKAGRDTGRQISDGEKKVKEMEKELEMLRKKQQEQESAEMQKILPAVASYLTDIGLSSEDQTLQKDLFQREENGYWHPAKRQVARVLSQAAAHNRTTMSAMNDQRNLLKQMIQERDALKNAQAATDNRKRVSDSLDTPGPTAQKKQKTVPLNTSTLLAHAESGGWGTWCTKS